MYSSSTGTWYDRSNDPWLVRNSKYSTARITAQYGTARDSTAKYRTARQGTAGQGTARRCAAELSRADELS